MPSHHQVFKILIYILLEPPPQTSLPGPPGSVCSLLTDSHSCEPHYAVCLPSSDCRGGCVLGNCSLISRIIISLYFSTACDIVINKYLTTRVIYIFSRKASNRKSSQYISVYNNSIDGTN